MDESADEDEQPAKKARLENLVVDVKGERGYSVCEVFSPPRVTKRARERGGQVGWAIDFKASDPITKRTYDLRSARDQNAVRRMLRRDAPEMLVVTPPCIVDGGNSTKQDMRDAVMMVRFAIELCSIQQALGRSFILEYPTGSKAWKLPCMIEFLITDGIMVGNCGKNTFVASQLAGSMCTAAARDMELCDQIVDASEVISKWIVQCGRSR